MDDPENYPMINSYNAEYDEHGLLEKVTVHVLLLDGTIESNIGVVFVLDDGVALEKKIVENLNSVHKIDTVRECAKEHVTAIPNVEAAP